MQSSINQRKNLTTYYYLSQHFVLISKKNINYPLHIKKRKIKLFLPFSQK